LQKTTGAHEIRTMGEEEYRRKYVILRILKSIQKYLKNPNNGEKALYPIHVPNDFLIQVLRNEGTAFADDLIHEIFRLGLKSWADQLYCGVFGTTKSLESFIAEVKHK